jgi:hypothetical protein
MAIDTEVKPDVETPEHKDENKESPAPQTPEKLATQEQAIEAIKHFVKNDTERTSIRYGERGLLGFLGKVNSWLHKEGTRLDADDIENVGKWEKNGKWKKWLKMGVKVGGGVGVAAAMTFTGGLGAVLTPLLWGSGVREAWNGILEVGEELGWGRKRTRLELGSQEKMTEIIEKIRNEVKGGSLTEDQLKQYIHNMNNADNELFESQNANLKQERKHKFIRSIASSVLTIGTGFMTGVPLGTADYDKGATAIGESGKELAEKHKVVFNYNWLKEKIGGFFVYNKEAPYTGFPNEAEFAKSVAEKFNYPLHQVTDVFSRSLHTLGHGLPVAEKIGLWLTGGQLIARNFFDKMWPSGKLVAPKKYELPKDEYISYPETPKPSPEPTPEPSPEPTSEPEPEPAPEPESTAESEPTTDEEAETNTKPSSEPTPEPVPNVEPEKPAGDEKITTEPTPKPEPASKLTPESAPTTPINTKSEQNTENKNDQLINKEKISIEKYFTKLKHKFREYFSEIENTAVSLPKMDKQCRISIIMPARNESENILKPLEIFAAQKELDGSPLDPNKYEINILINRPNNKEPWDNTLEKIKEFKAKHPNMKINAIKKTFNFVPASRVKMGIIFKTIADLALYRSFSRTDQTGKHIIMPTGADYLSRGENHIAKTIKIIDENPKIDQLITRIDLPREAYLEKPLLHVSQRMLEFIMLLMYNPKYSPFKDPERKINGESAYTANIYSRAEGYNPEKKIAEDLDLAARIRIKGGKARKSGLKSITSPRRKINALEEHGHLLHAYNNFFKDESIKNEEWTKIIKRMRTSEKKSLDLKTLNRHLSIFYDFTLKRAKQSGNPEFEKIATKIFEKTMRWIGVEGILYINKEGIGSIKITNFEKLTSGLEKYKTRKNIRKPV